MSFPDLVKKWNQESNYIVCLVVENEMELKILLNKAGDLKIKAVEFREPDLDNAMTAIVLEPSSKAKELCRNLKLMGR